jgi:hypothetical protein
MSVSYFNKMFEKGLANKTTETIEVQMANDRKFINAAGDTMIGTLDMQSFGITNLKDPVNSKDATTKSYVDSNKTTDASLLTSGILNDSRLSNNVALKTYVDLNKTTDASLLTSGILNDSRLSNNVALKTYVDNRCKFINFWNIG